DWGLQYQAAVLGSSELLLIPDPCSRSLNWVDLLFTMSDIARARRCNRERADKFLNERAYSTAAASRLEVWWSQTGSNRRPPACKAGALPTELWPRNQLSVTGNQSSRTG